MRFPHALGLGIAAYAIALVAYAPATLVDAALNRATHGTLRIAEARGSAWHGRGYLELIDPRNSVAVAKTIDWHLQPLALWRGVAAFELRIADVPSPATLTLSTRGLELRNAAVDIPAGALALVVPRLSPAQLTGDLSLSASHIVIDGGAGQAEADLRWRNAGSALTNVAPLGEYSMHVRGDRDGFHAKLVTVRGPLDLQGEGSWRRPGRPSFSTIAHVPPEYSERLSPILKEIAGASDPDAFPVSLR